MAGYVTDTHAFYWHLTNDARLSQPARQIFVGADQGIHRVHVPGIVLIEMVYLVEKGRLIAAVVENVLSLLEIAGTGHATTPLNVETARALRRVPRSMVPDMPDRIIVANALQLGLPLISRDLAIQRSGAVPIIW